MCSIGIIIVDPTYFFLCPVSTLKKSRNISHTGSGTFFACDIDTWMSCLFICINIPDLHQAQGPDVNQSVVFNSIAEDLFLGVV